MKILYGDGVHDDTEAMRAWFRGEAVRWADGRLATNEPFHVDNPLQTKRLFRLAAQSATEAQGRKHPCSSSRRQTR